MIQAWLARHFAQWHMLLLLPIAMIVFGIMLAGDISRRRATRKLGDESLLDKLTTFDAGPRRTWKGAIRVLAIVLAVFAAARPVRPRGTKVIPAADVTVMVVLDVSKSMYAEDVLPSRIVRAKNDISRMIRGLPQIRWGAVAFAGEAIAFEPTSDGPQAADFLSSYEPADMPGGTAIAKALELARRQLVPRGLDGQPQVKKSRQKNVIVLVTDGEDLEGDPAAVARSAFEEGTRIDVVAIGGRAPQPIPFVDPDSGVKNGYARDDEGQLVMTELSPDAERQLKSIATETKGRFIGVEDGTTGLAAVEADLKSLIAKEGVETTEALFSEAYHWPLGAMLLLLLLDVAIGEAPRRKRLALPYSKPPRRRADV